MFQMRRPFHIREGLLMTLQILFGVCGLLAVVGVYFWFVNPWRSSQSAQQTDKP
jgi:hypothetical protein